MKFLIPALSAVLLSGSLFAGEVSLPAPAKSGGKPVLNAIADRASAHGNPFPAGKISAEEISTILWAGSGLNRPDRWTVPFGMGVKPYVRIYLADENGVHLYKWASHALERTTDRDIRSVVSGQPFAKVAPCILVFVSDRTSLKERGRMSEHWAKWTYVAAGAMTQQIYLAADSLGIGARYVEGMDAPLLRSLLSIPEDEEPICIMPLGKR